MILEPGDMMPSAELLAENAEMAARFSQSGVDLPAIQAMDFMCDFRDEEVAERFLQAVRAAARAPENLLPTVTQTHTWTDEEPCDRPTLVRVTFAMGFKVEDISRIETAFLSLSNRFGGGEVSWEFSMPGIGPKQ